MITDSELLQAVLKQLPQAREIVDAIRLQQPEEQVIEPYAHDSCEHCVWVGWCSSLGMANIWRCQESVIIRFSDEPSDYWSMRSGGDPISCHITRPDTYYRLEQVKARCSWCHSTDVENLERDIYLCMSCAQTFTLRTT